MANSILIKNVDAQFVCRCTNARFDNVQALFRHLGTHDWVQDAICGLDRCTFVGTNFKQFKNHVYRQHSIVNFDAIILSGLVTCENSFFY